MRHQTLFEPLSFTRGPAMNNRFMLAPLTNMQSHPDGRLSEDEFRWLTMRATGGFGHTMTCAAHVQAVGKGFEGQLGNFSDDHLEGLARLAAAIKAESSVSSVQLHHAGNRSPRDLVGQPVGASDDAESGARALTTGEVEALRDDFIAAAVRAERAGFEGVEIHGAHGYVVAQFLSPTVNRRGDRYGGSLENRARLLFEILRGIREACGPQFQLGLRMSPERYDLGLSEMRDLAGEVLRTGGLDYLDMSLWDYAKQPLEEAFKGPSLMSYFAELPRGNVRLGVAGKITTPAKAAAALEAGADFVLIGRAAVLHHDFPRLAREPGFQPIALPASRAHLRREGLSDTFIGYMNNWPGFVEPDAAAAPVS